MIYQLDSLRQIYAGRTVLDIDRLEVREGEILALVGPSGAGKSTLLRLLNFLETPAAGSITFKGQRITNGQVPLELRRQSRLSDPGLAGDEQQAARARGGPVKDRAQLAELFVSPHKRRLGKHVPRCALLPPWRDIGCYA